MRIDRYECQLTDNVKCFFRNRGFRFQENELQFFDYNIDIYCYNRPQQKTVAIELKVYNWKRAIQQAQIYQLCSDYVYIAMPEETIQRIDRKQLETEGIGLLCVCLNGRCIETLKPQISQEINYNYKNKFIAILGTGTKSCQ
jgi:hypothetical protein